MIILLLIFLSSLVTILALYYLWISQNLFEVLVLANINSKPFQCHILFVFALYKDSNDNEAKL